MSQLALSVLLLAASVVSASELPPGAVARLGDDRFRAGGLISHLALSPDGKQFATAQGIGFGSLTLTVWDSATGRPVRAQTMNSELFMGFVWGKGGAFAVALHAEPGTKDRPATLFADDFRVWDFTDPKVQPPPMLPVSMGFEYLGRMLAERPKGRGQYTGFEFSADGKRVAALYTSAGGKHAVHVFELKLGVAAKLARVGTIDLGAEGADYVKLSADGKRLVTFRTLANPGGGFVATAWDVAAGRPAKPVGLRGWHRFMVTPDGRALILLTFADDDWGFDLLDLGTGQRRPLSRWPKALAPFDDAEADDLVGGCAFAPTGRELVVTVGRKTFVIDMTTGKARGHLEGHAVGPGLVAVSADGTCIATADFFGLVRLWDAKSLRTRHDAPGHRGPVAHAELSPDGKRLLTWAEDKTVRLWDVATGKELRAFAGAVGVARANTDTDRPTFTPDGTTVLYSTKDHLIARDLQTGLEVPLPGDMAKLKPRFVAFAPDGKAVLTWADYVNAEPVCEVWTWPTGKKRFELVPDTEMNVPGFSPDGAAVFVDARSPRRWDAKTGKELPLAWKDNRRNRVDSLLSLRPNPHLVLDDLEENPRVLEAGTGKVVPRFRFTRRGEHTNLVGAWGVALSPTGGQYAWALGVREPAPVQLSESATCTVRRELYGHRGGVCVLGFTPDGTKLLTAGGDHTVLVWDVRLHRAPLPDALKKETNAAKLWDMLATGKADAAYLAMARLAREPDAAVKLVRMRLKPAATGDAETEDGQIADARAVELLEALGTADARALLKAFASGAATAFRTQEAKRALQRLEKTGYNANDK